MGEVLADLGGDLGLCLLRKRGAQLAQNFRRGNDHDLTKGVGQRIKSSNPSQNV